MKFRTKRRSSAQNGPSKQDIKRQEYAAKLQKMAESAEHDVTAASVTNYIKRNDKKKYRFVLQVTRQSGVNVIYRTYEDFYDFHITLLDAFPDASGRTGERVIPFLPGPRFFVTETVTKIRANEIQSYLRDLFTLPDYLLKTRVVAEFFLPTAEDDKFNNQVLAKPRKTSKSEGDTPAAPVNSKQVIAPWNRVDVKQIEVQKAGVPAGNELPNVAIKTAKIPAEAPQREVPQRTTSNANVRSRMRTEGDVPSATASPNKMGDQIRTSLENLKSRNGGQNSATPNPKFGGPRPDQDRQRSQTESDVPVYGKVGAGSNAPPRPGFSSSKLSPNSSANVPAVPSRSRKPSTSSSTAPSVSRSSTQQNLSQNNFKLKITYKTDILIVLLPRDNPTMEGLKSKLEAKVPDLKSILIKKTGWKLTFTDDGDEVKLVHDEDLAMLLSMEQIPKVTLTVN
ncbi:hypothetical protein BKA69DRAFT_1090037 [Paraphysoderma sedebokerense]|nr:hypothetical protein BKA69DRAFT_1178058 [Paraphysoderma sedebokerense]KAI9138681.1 hypothetical protein BKA69DRAFT_1090037 [Paraphysoderma sedebokerense]